MTESEWLVCADPQKMLPGRLPWVDDVSDRKGLLFKVACCRRIWDLMHGDSRAVVEQAEMYADQGSTYEDVAAACDALLEHGASIIEEIVVKFDYDDDGWAHWDEVASKTVMAEAGEVADQVAEFPQPRHQEAYNLASEAAEKAQADLLRDLLGNPFHPVGLDPAWLTPTVLSLAQAAYDERILPSGELEPSRLAVLSDALEEAGCTDAALLSHLRSPGPHVRGCWALDLILGKQ